MYKKMFKIVLKMYQTVKNIFKNVQKMYQNV